MRRFVLFALAPLLACCGPAFAQGDGWQSAVVRLSSHGLTGTVVLTGKDRSLILTAAHGFVEGGDRTRVPIQVDVPASRAEHLPDAVGRPRLLGLDARRDLALVELPAGPMPCIPVAPADYRPSGTYYSCGYDEMRWQNGPLIRQCTPVRNDGETIWTREIPWHGRSGGPLLDVERGVLVGVVQGYLDGGGVQAPGMYVSTQQVRAFVAKYTPAMQAPAPQPTATDGWTFDPKSGGYFRNLSPAAQAQPAAATPGCDCGWTGQCRCGPGCQCPECNVGRRAITPGVVQVPPQRFAAPVAAPVAAPQTCPNGQCPNIRPQIYAPAPSCPNGQCGRIAAPVAAPPPFGGVFVNPSCPSGNCPLRR